jgi:UDP-N-acetylglucosamine 2-epimerase (non-hydrolysing)
MLKILSIFGTRPEAIKMAPVVQQLARQDERIISKVCVTAQHREMLDQVLQLFGITPDYDLDIMKGNQSPTSVTIAVLRELEPILRQEKPDWVLVQGDTTTVMAASLAAFYQQVKVGHVEAGLRTHDIYQPFPEEVNRRIAGVVASLNFAPTSWAANNLLMERVPAEKIVVTGNTVIDAIRQAAEMPYDPAGTVLADLPLGKKRLILVTAHRRESFGRGITAICEALREIAETFDDVHLVYPVHLNPNVWEPVHQHLGRTSNISLTPPLEYLPLVYLMKHAHLVVTDSGGIQEEAPGLGVPVLVLREVTERPEGVEAGTVRLVGTLRERIVAEIRRLLEDETAYREMARAVNPYGDGQAAVRIVKALLGDPFEPWELMGSLGDDSTT